MVGRSRIDGAFCFGSRRHPPRAPLPYDLLGREGTPDHQPLRSHALPCGEIPDLFLDPARWSKRALTSAAPKVARNYGSRRRKLPEAFAHGFEISAAAAARHADLRRWSHWRRAAPCAAAVAQGCQPPETAFPTSLRQTRPLPMDSLLPFLVGVPSPRTRRRFARAARPCLARIRRRRSRLHPSAEPARGSGQPASHHPAPRQRKT